jgi:hypothetical protein
VGGRPASGRSSIGHDDFEGRRDTDNTKDNWAMVLRGHDGDMRADVPRRFCGGGVDTLESHEDWVYTGDISPCEDL